jgi:integrative and conjugative element protein (TIGR02256 family)
MTDNYEAWSEDEKYGLRVPAKVIRKMLNLCLVSVGNETGGILIGYYNRQRDCAIVTGCSEPPEDSKRGMNFFHRGIQGLQKWINKLWKLEQRRYYLGEWHFHPFSNPSPSSTDTKQMKINAKDKSYSCSEPILFIIGGDPNTNCDYRAFVYVKDKGTIELLGRCEYS